MKIYQTMKQKLFSGQQQIKAILILLFILVFVIKVSALELSISPYKLNFSVLGYQRMCKNISLSSDKNIIVTCQDRWTKNNFSKNIIDYKDSVEMLSINILYEKSFIIEKSKKTIEVCISGEKDGKYYGVLLCNSGNAGVGSWLDVEIKETEKERKEEIRLTGAAIGASQSSQHIIFLTIFTLILIFISVFMINKLRKLKKL